MTRERRGLLRYLGRILGPATAPTRRARLTEDAQAALDACSDAVLGIDAAGVCVVSNTVAETLFGRGRPEMVGIGAHQLLPGLATAIDEITARRRRGDRRAGPSGPGTEATAVRADGARFPVAVWLSPAYSPTAGLTVFVTVRDLTAARATAAAHAELREEVTGLRECVTAIGRGVRDRAIWVLDADGHIMEVNRAGEKLLGYRAEEIAGRPCSALSDPADLDAVARELGSPPGSDPLLEITRSGLPNQQEWNLLTKGGQRQAVTLNIVAVGARQRPQGFVWVAADRGDELEPLVGSRSAAERLLLDLDDAETRALRWQVGGYGAGRRR